jgi:murein biosynthesis integral membrane protein MurJ
MSDLPTPSVPNAAPQRSLTDRILRASAIVFAAHIILKFCGLIQAKLIAQYFGADSVSADVWTIIVDKILFAIFLIGEESLGPAFLPVFKGALDDDRESDAWTFARTVIFGYGVAIALVCAAFIAFPDAILRQLTAFDGGDAALGENVLSQAAAVLPYAVIGLFGLSIGSITYVILNGYKKFFIAALGDSAYKIGLIIALFVLASKYGAWAAAAGFVAGGTLKLALHLFGLRDKKQYFLSFKINFRSPEFKKMMALTAPILIGILFARFRDYITDLYAISNLYDATNDRNWISLAAFGKKIYQTIHHIVPYAISIAMYPYFVELIDKSDRDALGQFITRSSRMIIALLLPVSFAFAALMTPLSQLLFSGGKTTFATATEIGLINAVYVLVLAPQAVETFLLQGFFSDRRMLSPILIGLAFSAATAGISVLICHPEMIGLGGLNAVLAVGATFVAARWLKMATLIIWFKRRTPSFPLKETAVFFLRAGALAVAVGACVLLVDSAIAGRMTLDSRKADIVRLAVGGAVSAIVYLAGSRVLKLNELTDALKYCREKIAGHRGSVAKQR